MTRTLTALYDTRADAENAVSDLEAAGIPHANISIVANRGPQVDAVDEGDEAGPGAGAGATLGTVVGGGAGLLAGLGLLAIPGLGPVVAAGWLVSTVVGAAGGAALGGASGGLIGAMIGNGVPENEAHVYAEGIRRGGSLVTVRVEEGQVSQVNDILQRHRVVDPAQRAQTYRQGGWNRFDENAPGYVADETALSREDRRTSV